MQNTDAGSLERRELPPPGRLPPLRQIGAALLIATGAGLCVHSLASRPAHHVGDAALVISAVLGPFVGLGALLLVRSPRTQLVLSLVPVAWLMACCVMKWP